MRERQYRRWLVDGEFLLLRVEKGKFTVISAIWSGVSRHSSGGLASYEKFSSAFFPFLPLISFLTSLLSPGIIHEFPQVFPYHQPISINHGFRLRLIQTLGLRSSHSASLHKTLTDNHYLRIDYFQYSFHPTTTTTTYYR